MIEYSMEENTYTPFPHTMVIPFLIPFLPKSPSRVRYLLKSGGKVLFWKTDADSPHFCVQINASADINKQDTPLSVLLAATSDMSF